MSSNEGEPHPLLARVLALLPPGAFRRVLVVCPAASGAAALRRAVTRTRTALAGVDFVTAAGFARQLLLIDGQTYDPTTPDALEEREFVRDCLGEDAAGEYARAFPTALDALVRAVQELLPALPGRRDGGIDELGTLARQTLDVALRVARHSAGRGGRSRWLAQAIERLGAPGGALPDLVIFAGYLHPEPDVLLARELLAARGVPVLVADEAMTDPGGDLSPLRLASAGNPLAELRMAAGACMDAAAAGMPWHEMVIAAPSLEPYRPLVEYALELEGVPLHTAVGHPLAQSERAALALHLARTTNGTAPRRSWLALASSPLLCQPVPADELAELEVRSRWSDLRGNGPAARQVVRDLAGAPAARQLLDSVFLLADRMPAGRGFAERSALLKTWMDTWLRPPAEAELAVDQRLNECFRVVGCTEREDSTGASWLAEFEELLRTRLVGPAGRSTDGVHFVSLRDALAIPCRHLQLIGMSQSAVPAAAPPTTFLGDADREHLGLPTRASQREHEGELLVQLARHAEHVGLSYPRRDGSGREQGVSLWLDRIGAARPLAALRHEPSHPATFAARRLASGRCPPDLGLHHLGMSPGRNDASRADALAELAGGDGARALEHAARLETFAAQDLSRDGDVGSRLGLDLATKTFAVTELERMGRCPQQFFFRDVLRVRPLPPEPDELSVPQDRLGTLIHSVAESVYGEFLPRLRAAEAPSALAAGMAERAGVLLREELGGARGMLRGDFPGLHELQIGQWLAGLATAIRADLSLMEDDGSRPREVEHQVQGSLALRHGDDEVTLLLEGKVDRIDDLAAGGTRVVDYKTGSNPGAAVNGGEMLKGERLQLLLYAMVLESSGQPAAEQLEIRALQRRRGSAVPELRHVLDKAGEFLRGRLAAGVRETLVILGRLLARGAFAPRQGRHCGYCDFRSACRRYHPPSAERVQATDVPELQAYFRLGRKSTRTPLLGAAEDGDA